MNRYEFFIFPRCFSDSICYLNIVGGFFNSARFNSGCIRNRFEIPFIFVIFKYHEVIVFRPSHNILIKTEDCQNWFYSDKNRGQLLDYLLQQLLNDRNTWFTLETTVAKQFHDLSDGVSARFTLFVIPIEYIDFFLPPDVITAGKLCYWILGVCVCVKAQFRRTLFNWNMHWSIEDWTILPKTFATAMMWIPFQLQCWWRYEWCLLRHIYKFMDNVFNQIAPILNENEKRKKLYFYFDSTFSECHPNGSRRIIRNPHPKCERTFSRWLVERVLPLDGRQYDASLWECNRSRTHYFRWKFPATNHIVA